MEAFLLVIILKIWANDALQSTDIMTSDQYTIAYEDPDFIIVNKVQGAAVQNKTNDAIIDHLTKKYGKELHLISRLDQPVSGLFIVAISKEASIQLSLQVSLGSIHKKYTAIVEGKVAEESGDLTHKLLKVGQKSYVNEEGKNCQLSFTKLPGLDRYDVLDVKLGTGRFHQIRAQLAAYGHPIKGDLKYGAKRSVKGGGICLHCREITMLHPNTKEKITAIANLPQFDVWKFVDQDPAS